MFAFSDFATSSIHPDGSAANLSPDPELRILDEHFTCFAITLHLVKVIGVIFTKIKTNTVISDLFYYTFRDL